MLKNTGSHRIVAVVGTSLVEKVEEAAEKCRVPKELLLTVGYANTHQEMPLRRLAPSRKASSTARALSG